MWLWIWQNDLHMANGVKTSRGDETRRKDWSCFHSDALTPRNAATIAAGMTKEWHGLDMPHSER